MALFCHKQQAKLPFLGTAARAPEPTELQQFQKRWTHLEQNCSTQLVFVQKGANRSPVGGLELVSGAEIRDFCWQIRDSPRTDRQRTERRDRPRPHAGNSQPVGGLARPPTPTKEEPPRATLAPPGGTAVPARRGIPPFERLLYYTGSKVIISWNRRRGAGTEGNAAIPEAMDASGAELLSPAGICAKGCESKSGRRPGARFRSGNPGFPLANR